MPADSTSTATDQHFRDALTSLETTLATPIVSGELVEWARNADSALRNFLLRWLERRDVTHHQTFEQIGEEDPELLGRVEQLEQEDDQITRTGQQLASRAASLAETSEAAERNETKLSTQALKLADDGLVWLAHVRRQEVAVQAWLTEATHRDRGAVD